MSDQPSKKPASISIQVEAIEFPVIPGSSTTIDIYLQNQGNQEDDFELTTYGVASAWVTIPTPVIHLAPGERKPVSLLVNAPPPSQRSAGWYPIKLRAVSRQNPKQSDELEITLKVAVYEVQGRIGVLMHSNQFTVTPGGTITIPIVLRNQGLEKDTFRLAIQGISTAWVSTPSPTISLDAGEQKGITINIHPPRSPLSRAGRHPFSLQVISQSYPEQITSVECILTVSAYTQFACDLEPAEIQSAGQTRVTIKNQGNIQQSYTITCFSSKNELNFLSDSPNPVRVGAGEAGLVEITVEPRRRPLLGREVKTPFSVKITSAEKESQILEGTVNRRGVFPVWAFGLIAILLAGAICFASFFLFQGVFQNYIATRTAIAQITQISATQTAAFNQTAAAVIGQGDDDGDGLTNQQESEWGTAPNNPDTDRDELKDGDEVLRLGTDPKNRDTDADGLADGEEVLRRGTDPKNPDTDGDRLTDGEEVRIGTNPTNADSDEDGLNDGDEIQRGTNPLNPDTDGDRLNDGDEVRFGTNPLNPDTDSDRLADGQESQDCPNILNPDTDGDGIIDGSDLDACNPNNPSLTATAGAAQPTIAPPTQAPPTGQPTLNPTPPTVQGVILFESNRDGNFEIYASDASNGVTFRLTNNPAQDIQPVWSPDGALIAFTSNRDGNNEIYVMNADGSNPINLSNNPADDQQPSWSPDSQWIAFTTNRDGNQEIYAMRADGTDLMNLSNNPANDTQPCWFVVEHFLVSDEWIAFTSDRDGNLEVYTMRANGLEQVNITLDTNQDQTPQGNQRGQIVFSSNRQGNYDIYSVNLDGTGLAQLTTNAAQDMNPVWSPDERWVAFSTDRDGNPEIYIMRSNGSDFGNFSRNPAADNHPTWR